MNRVATLTIVIIARDEADRIGAAIASACFAQEILVIESQSTDDTAAVARAAGARVVQTDWPGFVQQKQRGVELAKTEWVFALDADERISPELAAEIAAAVHAPDGHVAYSVARTTWWQGEPLRHGAWSPDRRCRLFRRARGVWGGTDPHDQWLADGPVGRLSTPLIHHAYRDLQDHLRTLARYAELQADGLVLAGRRARWWDWSLRPVLHLFKAVFLKRGFMDGPRGLAVAFLGAAHVALKWSLVALRQPGEGT